MYLSSAPLTHNPLQPRFNPPLWPRFVAAALVAETFWRIYDVSYLFLPIKIPISEVNVYLILYHVLFPPSQVVLLGMDILSALVSRLQERFRTQVGTGEPMFKVQT